MPKPYGVGKQNLHNRASESVEEEVFPPITMTHHRVNNPRELARN
jgi:hypothetical protein